MVLGVECPFIGVLDVGFDGGEVCRDVKVPSRSPMLKFLLQFGPLLVHSGLVFTLVVEQERRSLNHSLDQQDFLGRRRSFFQTVPQVFPGFMRMPKFSLVEQGAPFFQESALLRTQGFSTE